MRHSMPDNMPPDVRVERFARRTVNIGFVGGQEKTVEYDVRVDKVNPDETHYRQYLEADRDEAKPGTALEKLARKRNVFTLTDRESVVYRELQNVETKFLVTLDDGKTVRIADAEGLDTMISAAGTARSVEPAPAAEQTASEEIEEALDTQDTDIPAPDTEKDPVDEPDTDIPEPASGEQAELDEPDTDIPEPVSSEQ